MIGGAFDVRCLRPRLLIVEAGMEDRMRTLVDDGKAHSAFDSKFKDILVNENPSLLNINGLRFRARFIPNDENAVLEAGQSQGLSILG